MTKHRWWSVIILLVALGLAYFLFIEQKPNSRFPFKYGLDLVGGTELIYTADTTGISDVTGSMETLKEVVERRVNIFGVSEPLIQIESAGLISGNKTERLIVELPGITDIEQAKAQIGKTPILEFRLLKPESEELLKSDKEVNLNDIFYPAELTGKYVEKAQVLFDPNTRVPTVGLNFNSEGKALFAKITKENIGKPLTIILDGVVKSSPVIQSEITDGKAVITGNFTAEEAKTLVRDLNYGALPIPITLSSSQTIGPSLGEAAFNSGLRAGIIGFIALSIFLILWYRLPGLIAVIALCLYIVLSLTLFKLIPVTLTAAGLAGFILSIGMAVDANVLIFERTKEELKKGKSIYDALHEGFTRAWLSIRDSNISSIITAIVLFWLGTSAVKGFALTLGVGVLVSMFTAITASRTFLFAIAPKGDSRTKRFLFSNGFHIK
jgi:preprotein translocase subunit SecD